MPPHSPRARWVRRAGAGALALLVSLGLLAGACGSDGGGSTSDTTAPGAPEVHTTSLDDVTVTGDPGTKPTVTFDPAYQGTGNDSRVLSEGDGATIEDGQRVLVDYVVVSGADGAELGTTYGATPEPFDLDDQTLQPVVAEALVGQQVGVRVLLGFDATQTSGQWNLAAFEVTDAYTVPTSAEGTPVEPAPGLPTVTVEGGVPTIATPEGEPPTELVVQPLIEGTGPPLEEGQTATVQYVGVIWASGSVFDSSWQRGAPVDFPLIRGGLIDGIVDGLVGQPVGSRVMVVVPPDKGYGADGNPDAGISGTDTLVFVVDILATAGP